MSPVRNMTTLSPNEIATIRHIINRHFGLVEIVDARRYPGFVNRNYEIFLNDNIYKVVVLRIFGRNTWRNRLRLELKVIDILNKHNILQTPVVLGHSNEGIDVVEPYIIMTKLPGITLTDALPSLDQSAQRDLGHQIGVQLAAIHSIKLEYFGELAFHDLVKVRSERDYTLHRAQILLEQCEYHELLSIEEIRWLAKWFTDESYYLDRQLPVLVHGDFTTNNILIEPQQDNIKVTGIIDFEQSAAWSPELDFVKTPDFIGTQYPALVDSFIEGYFSCVDDARQQSIFSRRLELYKTLIDLQVLIDISHINIGAVTTILVRYQSMPLLHLQRLYTFIRNSRA